MKAQYRIFTPRVEGLPADALVIEDIGHSTGMSVTNDAEAVIEDLRQGLYLTKQDGSPRRVFYFDSQGELAELLHHDGTFMGFEPLGRR